ncbi:hypothetical protein Hdeb2414_s0023g00640721 [Helianthus debilis subsp. tardiflorus]
MNPQLFYMYKWLHSMSMTMMEAYGTCAQSSRDNLYPSNGMVCMMSNYFEDIAEFNEHKLVIRK